MRLLRMFIDDGKSSNRVSGLDADINSPNHGNADN